MNKYAKESRRAQRQAKLFKSCVAKRRYATEADAFQKGQSVYKCNHCGGWHRTGALAKLIVQLSRRKKK